VAVAAVPWADHDARLTRSFDEQVAWLAVQCNQSAVSELMRVSWRTVGWIVARVSRRLRAGKDQLQGLRRIGIDEVSFRRGQKYLILVVDHDSGRLVWAAEGRDEKTLDRFFLELDEERAKLITHVSADAGSWIANVVALRCPNAVRCMDPFHVVQWATDALDPPGGLERGSAGWPHAARARSQGRAMGALEGRRAADRAAAGKAGLDREDEPAALPRLSSQRANPPCLPTPLRRRPRPPRRSGWGGQRPRNWSPSRSWWRPWTRT
jgi:transposase